MRLERVAIVLLLAAGSALLRANDGDGGLDGKVRARIASFASDVSVYAKNLKTGQTYGLKENDPVRTASTIKLPIMIECFEEAAEGKLDWKEPVRLAEEEKVTGSGVLQDFSAGDSFPIRDLMTMMIVVSDNTATNLILNRIGGDAVNARMATLGFTHTRVMRKILNDHNDFKSHTAGVTAEGAKPENGKWGLGRSSPREMVELLEKLYRGELVNKESSAAMIDVLKKQRDHSGIARDMALTVANKSGALDHLRSDVGIVYSKNGPVAMALTVDNIKDVDWSPDNAGEKMISALSELLIAGLAGN